MIKAIIFDCFGVLTTDHWKEFTGTLLADIATQARDLNHAYNAGMITRQEFITQVAAVAKVDEKRVEQAITSDSNKNLQLLSYIKELKPSYKIGLLSNIGDNWIRERFLNPEEQTLFDAMTLSFEVGTTKPDPRMYQTACEKLAVEPSEAVFIDDIAGYCQAAEALGMKAVVYENFAQAKQAISQFVSPNAS